MRPGGMGRGRLPGQGRMSVTSFDVAGGSFSDAGDLEPAQPLSLHDPRDAFSLEVGTSGVLANYCGLFLDVHGSTAHLQELGNDEVQRTVGDLVAEIGRIVEARDGFLAEIQGDGALVLFGGRERFDRAVAVASEIQNLVTGRIAADFRRRTGRTFEIGVGVARGDVIARCVHSDRGISWLCLCTNMAAKLAKNAPAGTVFVTFEVYQALSCSEVDLSVRWQTGFEYITIGSVDYLVKAGLAEVRRVTGPRFALHMMGLGPSVRRDGDEN